MSDEIAVVRLSCGRNHLFVCGIALATEGDVCRQPLPDELYDIPEEEMRTATIGGEPIVGMSKSLIQFFRGGQWDSASLNWAAEQINAKAKAKDGVA